MGWYQLTLAGYASSRSSVACSVLPSAPDHELQDSFAPHARGFTGGRETATCRNWHLRRQPSARPGFRR
jgi:hypothetical protein